MVEGNYRLRIGADANYQDYPESHICRQEITVVEEQLKTHGLENRPLGNESNLKCSLAEVSPFQRKPNNHGILVKAAAALTYPAVVSHKLSPFLHLL